MTCVCGIALAGSCAGAQVAVQPGALLPVPESDRGSRRCEALGPEQTARLFPIDHAHTSAEGAEMNAESVAIPLKEAGSQLALYLKPW